MGKRALCIGINDYPDSGRDLPGCVNDADDWAEALGARGFQVVRRVDGEATLAGIVEAIREGLAGVAEGESFVLTYSGFGSFVPGVDIGGADLREALCPSDVAEGRLLLLDEIAGLFAARPDVRTVMVSDTCHAGTVTRGDDQSFDPGTARMRIMPPQVWMHAGWERYRGAVPGGQRGLGEGLGDLLVTACKPYEFAWDARFGGRPNGVFTHYALEALAAQKPDATYAEWFRRITPGALPSGRWPQSPRMLCAPKMARSVAFG